MARIDSDRMAKETASRHYAIHRTSIAFGVFHGDQSFETAIDSFMRVDIIPALSDNYSYLLYDDGQAAVVDPADAVPVEARLRQLGVTLTCVLITHHHFDHVAGAASLAARHAVTIMAPASGGLPRVDRQLTGGDRIVLGSSTLQVLATPGHVEDHVCYYDPEGGNLFCGDTLFVCGCGRLMGPPAATLWESLKQLRNLPATTSVYCGHEYTETNIAFALDVDPGNDALRQKRDDVKRLRGEGQPTVPSRMGEEAATNPFMRADVPGFQAALGMEACDPVDVFAELRRRKDAW